MTEATSYHSDTLAVHAGQRPDGDFGCRAVPIYQSAAFVFRDAEQAGRMFDYELPDGHFYSRVSNPTVSVFEERMAALEGGSSALATASGQSAVTLCLLNLTRTKDRILSSSQIYGGTFTLFNHTFRRFGIHTQFVDIQNVDEVAASIEERTRAIYCESIGNPALGIPDFEALAEVAHEHGLPLIVDATVTPPPSFRAMEHGADLVVHSATKYIGGHGTTIGGVVVDSGKFDWRQGRFREFEMPSTAFHGKEYVKQHGASAFLTKARAELLFSLGCAMAPFNAFLLLQGLETLPLRLRKHSDNSLALAKWLVGHPKVAWVNYPDLSDHPQHARASKYFPQGCGGLLTFGVKGGIEAGRTFVESVRLASFLANIGDAKTLVLQPATTTHRQLSAEERKMSGVSDEMIRVSVGLEHIEDIEVDFDRALGQL